MPYPIEIGSATGGFVNDSVIIVGGVDGKGKVQNTGYVSSFLNDGLIWENQFSMAIKRQLARSLVRGKQLWVTGGADSDHSSFQVSFFAM